MDFSEMIREHKKPFIIVGSLLLCGILCLCLNTSSPVYRLIHKKGAEKLQETLMSESWVCYDIATIAGEDVAAAGRALVFEEDAVFSYIIVDKPLVLGGKSMYVPKLDNEVPYEVLNGDTIRFKFLGINVDSKVTFEENGNLMILSPSLPNLEKSKKWNRRSYFVEKVPEHAKMFEVDSE